MNNNKHDVLDLAKYIITEINSRKYFISLNKLNFLLYILQVMHLRKTDEPLFEEDIFVNCYAFYIEKVNSMFCGFGGGDILLVYPETKKNIELYVQDMVSYIIEKYGKSFLYKNNLINSSSIFNRVYNSNNRNKIKISINDMKFIEDMEI